jgi:tRNA threonylcarbamoyladenosine biosynthesis protein TsaE
VDFSFLSHNEQETFAWGERIAAHLVPGDVIGFFGELGSGKTRTIQGICNGLRCQDIVTSPTFTIINEYSAKYPIYHFDLYRIDSEQEIFALGYEEYFFGDGICLIEWAERIASLLPPNRIEIFLEGFFEPAKENLRKIDVKLFGSIILRNWEILNP